GCVGGGIEIEVGRPPAPAGTLENGVHLLKDADFFPPSRSPVRGWRPDLERGGQCASPCQKAGREPTSDAPSAILRGGVFFIPVASQSVGFVSGTCRAMRSCQEMALIR